MGLGRFIKHVLVPGTITMDFVKNMIDEGDIVKGYKKSINKRLRRIILLQLQYISTENMMERKKVMQRHLMNMKKIYLNKQMNS